MKKSLALLLGSFVAAGAFAAPAHIDITAPTIVSWTQTVQGVGSHTMDAGERATINGQLSTLFSDLELQLNTDYFDQLEGFNQLAKGFANANMAAFDNASLLGYQTYDLFAASVGFNLSGASPSTDPSAAVKAFNDVLTTGDVYAGVGTGGFAGQFGLNLGFLVKNLYGSVKVGFVPQIPINGISYNQGMFGIGANYTILPQVDLLFGFVKWRGLSLGSGIVFNSSSIDATVKLADQEKKATISAGGGNVDVKARSVETSMALSIKQGSTVIPIDLMTSLQALWFVNVGLGVGADLAFSNGSIGATGKSKIDVASDDPNASISTSAGSVTLTSPKGESGGDFFVPRIAASIGLNLAVLKLDVPLSYYPTTKAFSIGFTGAIVW